MGQRKGQHGVGRTGGDGELATEKKIADPKRRDFPS